MANEQNLKPAQPGEVRNPNGRPKGAKSWSTIVKNILEDEEMFEAILAGQGRRPNWIEKLNKKNGANAIVVAMIAKALGGDYRAADWLRKTGYGDKLDLTTGDEPMTALVKFVGGKKPEDEDDDSDGTDSR